MKVAITGASGRIGREVCIAIERAGHQAHPFPHRAELDLLGPTENVVAWLAQCKPDAIAHPAGARPPSDPAAMFATNVGATYALYRSLAFARQRPRVVVVSSAAVYGSQPVGKPISVSAKLAPETPYGAAKAAQEFVARTMGMAHDIDTIVARPFNVIGLVNDRDSLIPATVMRIRRASGVIRIRDLECIRDFAHVRDVARIIAAAATSPRAPTVFNIGTGCGRTVEWVVRQIYATLRIRTSFVGAHPPADSVAFSVADTTELRQRGWLARPLDEAILSELVQQVLEAASNTLLNDELIVT